MSQRPQKFDHQKIERKWQKRWQEKKIYQVDLDKVKKPFYNLMMFPYPSAEGLHVGNMYAFVHSDTYGRFMRLKGNDVFEPIGLDGFGIHSENYAIKIKEHIRDVSRRTEKHFYQQLHMIGNAYDWSRTVETYKSDYYKWTQWLFLKMYEKGLAYRKKSPVNWCPSCKTVLSDEQVIAGKCERCETQTEIKEAEQWFWKITDYAEKLLKNLDWIDWSEEVKTIQRNWIGQSQGAIIRFKIKSAKKETSELEVFTTRPDTLFGCTYMVLCPEHPLLVQSKHSIKNWNQVEKYIKKAGKKSNLERTELKRTKTGVKIGGLEAVNPVNQRSIPVFVADYIVSDYGTGAIMAVPAHDERDFEFAKRYDLPIKQVVEAISSFVVIIPESLDKRFIREVREFGRVIKGTGNWQGLDLIRTDEVDKVFDLAEKYFQNGPWYIHSEGPIKKILFHSKKGKSKRFNWQDKKQLKQAKNFGLKIGIKKEQLDFDQVFAAYTDQGKNINSGFLNGLTTEKAKKKMIEWLNKNKTGKKSVNYKLRDWCISRQRYWGPPIPMIYCQKCGWQPVPEKHLPVLLPDMEDFLPDGSGKGPLNKVKEFVNTTCPKCQGPAQRETDVSDPFVDSSWYYLRYPCTEFNDRPMDKKRLKKWMPVDMYIGGREHATLHLMYTRFVTMVMHELGWAPKAEPFEKFRAHGLLIREGAKISKSKGNVINPDEYIEKYGADTVRMYLMFMGDMRQGGDWRDSGIQGMYRFVNRLYSLFNKIEGKKSDKETLVLLHKTIRGVEEDLSNLRYNTAISKLMVLTNRIQDNGCARDAFEKFVILLSPFAPYLCEELWEKLGNKFSVHQQRWPEYNSKLVREQTVEIAVQVNGKFRGTVSLPAGSKQKEVMAQAKKNARIKKHLAKKCKKVIFVKDKIVNFICAANE